MSCWRAIKYFFLCNQKNLKYFLYVLHTKCVLELFHHVNAVFSCLQAPPLHQAWSSSSQVYSTSALFQQIRSHWTQDQKFRWTEWLLNKKHLWKLISGTNLHLSIYYFFLSLGYLLHSPGFHLYVDEFNLHSPGLDQWREPQWWGTLIPNHNLKGPVCLLSRTPSRRPFLSNPVWEPERRAKINKQTNKKSLIGWARLISGPFLHWVRAGPASHHISN